MDGHTKMKCFNSSQIYYVQYNIISSMGPSLWHMTSRNQNPNKGIESKMAAIWLRTRLSTSDDPVMRSVTPWRVSQRSRPQEGSVTS